MGVTGSIDPVVPDVPPTNEYTSPNEPGGGSGGGTTIASKITVDNGQVTIGNTLLVRPSVSFTWTVYCNRLVAFTDKTLNNPGYWKWTFGDGSTSTRKNPLHQFPHAGTWTVKLTCWSADLLSSSSYTTVVTVTDLSRTASLSIAQNTMEAVCTYTGTVYPGRILWDFGDGTTSTQLKARHTYTVAGVYTITVYVEDLSASTSFTATGAVNIFSKINTTPNTADIRGIKYYNGLVYACDAGTNRVLVFDEDDLATPIAYIGSAGTGDGQFSNGGPEWIDCDSTHIYVTDPQNATAPRVQKFDITTHAFVSKGTFPTAYPDKMISGIYVDPVNNYVYAGYVNQGTAIYLYRSLKSASPLSFSSWQTVLSVEGMNCTNLSLSGNTPNVFIAWKHDGLSTPQALKYYGKAGGSGTIATAGAGDGDINTVTGVACSDDGSIGYLADSVNGFVKVFNAITPTVVTDSGIEAQTNVFGLAIRGGNQTGDPSEASDYLLVYDQTDNEFRKYALYDNPQIIYPVSSFIYTVPTTSDLAPLTVTFTNTSIGDSVTYLWEFGDGQTSAAANPTHTYLQPGIYEVRLTTTNSLGSDVTVIIVTVTSTENTIGVDPPLARFTASPMQGVRNAGTGLLLVTCTDTSTGTPASWAWTFGDGGTSTSQNPTHNYSQDGLYIISLTVTDTNGFTSTASKMIVVSGYAAAADNPPTASISASPTSGTFPLSVQFTSVVNTPDVYYLWDFGDGTAANTANPSHVFGTPGTYEVSLTVTNSWGSTTSLITIVVQGVIRFTGGGDAETGIYILDRKNHQVLMYDSNGTYVGKLGGYGTSIGKFNDPTTLVVSRPKFRITEV